VLASVILIFWRMPPLNTPTFLQFIANLTMALGLFGQNVVDLPYWTLTYELVFYVFMAPALRFRLLGSIEWLGLLAMAVACIYRATVDIEHHRRTTIVLRAYYSNFFSYPHCLVHVALGYQIIRFGVEQG
jgi:hypothetical protein